MKLTEDEKLFGWTIKRCIGCGRLFKNHPDYDTDRCGQTPKPKVILRRKVEQFYAGLNDVSVEHAALYLKHNKETYLRYVAIYKKVKRDE